VEIDGPSHFYRDTNSRTTGSIMKNLLLSALGFHVRHLPYQEWAQCGTAEKRTLYCSTFWRDVLMAELPSGSQGSVEDQAKMLPLVDVLEMVITNQKEEQAKQKELTKVPAFYEQDNEDDARFEVIETVEQQSAVQDVSTEGDDYDQETQSVEAVLAAHEQAERQLASDRGRTLSARDRWRLDARKRRQSRPQREEASTEIENVVEMQPEMYRKTEVSDEVDVRELLPRTKRRIVRHSNAGLFDHEAMEMDTDSESSDDEASRQAPRQPLAKV